MAALQYVHVPDYSAIIFRRTYKDLALPGALMDRAHDWLDNTDAKWSESSKQWRFPSGAVLTFAYLAHERDKYNYQGSHYQFAGFDELTQFEEGSYRYIFSRLRRLEGVDIPIRCYSASNPGGIGHIWAKQRFLVEGKEKKRMFIPSKLEDNPYLDTAEYEESLKELPELERAQLRYGDWDAMPDGEMFKRNWFQIVDEYPSDAKVLRYWDLAATKPNENNDNPDWTAGVKIAVKDGRYWIIDVKRTRDTPLSVEKLIRQTAELDGIEVAVYMEQEGGSSGVNNIDHYRRKILNGFAFYADKPTGSKEARAKPLSSAAQAGNVFLVKGAWISDFLDEIVTFPQKGFKKDQVDAASAGYNLLHEIKEQKHAVKPTIGSLKRK